MNRLKVNTGLLWAGLPRTAEHRMPGALLGGIILLLLSTLFVPVQGATPSNTRFATVNGKAIAHSTYQTALQLGARQRFYHGKAPEAEMVAYRQELGQYLVEQELMHQEALRLGMKPDQGRVQSELGKMLQRYAQSPQWAARQGEIVPVLQQGLERGDRVRQLETLWRASVNEPSDQELLDYYRQHPETFTSPQRTQVSMILLHVPPWAGKPEWDRKLAEGERVHREILNGLPFAEAARRYSTDSSAENGGDMGYLHRGMLGEKAETVVEDLKRGDMSGPVVLLEGIALFYLQDRTPAQLNSFALVRDRAKELWLRERREAAVKLGKERLRQTAEIHFTDPRYFELHPETVDGRQDGAES